MLISCDNIYKSYFLGKIEVQVLKDISLEIEAGSYTAILGASGSGKSTLMNILGLLDNPSDGKYRFEDKDVFKLSKNRIAYIRNHKIGFVFQSFNLLSKYSVYHNIELPLIYSGLSNKERHIRVKEAVEMVGLEERATHRPNELSGGQRQRVAIARALVGRPSLILADEPTGNLDSHTGREILDVFKGLVDAGNTIIMVTHDTKIARETEKTITILDGVVSIDDSEKLESGRNNNET